MAIIVVRDREVNLKRIRGLLAVTDDALAPRLAELVSALRSAVRGRLVAAGTGATDTGAAGRQGFGLPEEEVEQ